MNSSFLSEIEKISLPDSNQRFLSSLKQRHHFYTQNRLIKTIPHPVRYLQPPLLRLINTIRPLSTQTFFNTPMHVVLPEQVSSAIFTYGFCDYTVSLALLLLLRKNMTFIDAGAHFGFFSLLAHALVGTEGNVLSFEPTPSTFTITSKNLAQKQGITLCNCAAFNKEAELSFFDYGIKRSAYNSFFGIRKDDEAEDTSHRITVKTRTIDSMVEKMNLKRVDLVKIDAESSEIQVLEGLAQTIERFHPAIIMEVGDFNIEGVASSRSIIDWLTNRGYQPFQQNGGTFVPHTKQESYSSDNILFLASGSET